ncbi:Helix-turn-helix domain protein [Candidatus Trichorickettsia mobilis]|uniref:Helix-turn-helix domain protein n=1 Tax=Candidatus Trichorickettsia mobilis TaxID=1346319 RepID=A0ABZ0US66_9RICK|nr:helix-turn-helix transcriptional regulator [Candidatus Trichorickettsia mobilis]WPY00356.1 Helix-turn-helix domain protein [Candidatus Trichorickettsia mobilis]
MPSKLKQARIKMGCSTSEAAQALHIREQYLIALEENDFSAIPGKVYVDGYLKLYSRYLGIDLVVNSVNTPHNGMLQSKITVEHKFSKYLVIVSILMLIITVISYNSVLRSNVDIDVMSIVENTEKVSETNYNIGIKYNEK